jgi:hypothetical protein
MDEQWLEDAGKRFKPVTGRNRPIVEVNYSRFCCIAGSEMWLCQYAAGPIAPNSPGFDFHIDEHP